MKKIFSLILLVIVFFNSNAQNPIFDITDFNNTSQDIYGAYHKDINNQLNTFEGTYVFELGNTSLKVVLQKKTMSSLNGTLYEDLIVGEYQYIVDGVQMINTLPQLSSTNPNKRNHSIDSNFIITSGDIGCEDCMLNEKALYGSIVENSTGNSGLIIMRKVIENQIPVLKIFINWELKHKNLNAAPLLKPILPGGYFNLERRIF